MSMEGASLESVYMQGMVGNFMEVDLVFGTGKQVFGGGGIMVGLNAVFNECSYVDSIKFIIQLAVVAELELDGKGLLGPGTLICWLTRDINGGTWMILIFLSYVCSSSQ